MKLLMRTKLKQRKKETHANKGIKKEEEKKEQKKEPPMPYQPPLPFP